MPDRERWRNKGLTLAAGRLATGSSPGSWLRPAGREAKQNPNKTQTKPEQNPDRTRTEHRQNTDKRETTHIAYLASVLVRLRAAYVEGRRRSRSRRRSNGGEERAPQRKDRGCQHKGREKRKRKRTGDGGRKGRGEWGEGTSHPAIYLQSTHVRGRLTSPASRATHQSASEPCVNGQPRPRRLLRRTSSPPGQQCNPSLRR
ncbi:hypothetical protein C2E23DRAFT_76242 [Lenzites betulinus]|nr:hypothetical protein C2E23DRAFT_76242 [Lenzites betulinus]